MKFIMWDRKCPHFLTNRRPAKYDRDEEENVGNVRPRNICRRGKREVMTCRGNYQKKKRVGFNHLTVTSELKLTQNLWGALIKGETHNMNILKCLNVSYFSKYSIKK